MILTSYTEIIEFIRYNLAQRLEDYKNYHSRLNLLVINSNEYIITCPEYNIHSEDQYQEPNRYGIINNLIDEMPHFNNLFEFIELIKTDQFKYIQTSLFSKGINRLESLCDIIYYGRININTFSEPENPSYKPLIGWDTSDYNHKIRTIASCIAYNQVFSDCNHRMSYYILEKYSQNDTCNLMDFINFIKSFKYFYTFNSSEWVNTMNWMIRHSYKFDTI
jgi:hypothetical protein